MFIDLPSRSLGAGFGRPLEIITGGVIEWVIAAALSSTFSEPGNENRARA